MPPVRQLGWVLDTESLRELDAVLIRELKTTYPKSTFQPLSTESSCQSTCEQSAAISQGAELFVRTEVTEWRPTCLVSLELVEVSTRRTEMLGQDHGRCDAEGIEETLRRLLREPPRRKDPSTVPGRDRLLLRPMDESPPGRLEDAQIFAVLRRHRWDITVVAIGPERESESQDEGR